MKIEGPKKVRKASIKTRSNTFNFRIVVSIREQKFNNWRAPLLSKQLMLLKENGGWYNEDKLVTEQ